MKRNYSKFSGLMAVVLCLMLCASSYSQEQGVKLVSTTFNYWRYATDVELQGHYAYLMAGEAGLQIFDVTNPAAPQLVGHLGDLGSDYDRLSVSGNLAAIYGGGLIILVDISNPARPRTITTIDSSYYTRKLKISENIAIVVEWNKIDVIDLSRPATPTVRTELSIEDLWRYTENVEISNRCVYIGSSNGIYSTQISVYDFNNPDTLISLPSIYDVDSTYSVMRFLPINNKLITVSNEIQASALKLSILDVSIPSHPTLTGWMALPDQTENEMIAISAEAGYTYISRYNFVTDSTLIQTIDIHNPSQPVSLGMSIVPTMKGNFDATSRKAYCAAGKNHFEILSLSDPENVELIGSYRTEHISSVAKYNQYVLAACENEGLKVIDASRPSQPFEVGSYHREGPARMIETGAYVGAIYHDTLNSSLVALYCDTSGIDLLSMTEPRTPTFLSNIPTGSHVKGMTFWGDYLMICDSTEGLQVVDISTPESPEIIGSVPGTIYDMTYDGDMAYLVGANGLEILNMSDIANPTYVGDFGESFTKVTLGEGIVYALNYNYGLFAIDVSHPEQPVLRNLYRFWYGTTMSTEGDYALIGNEYRMQVVNIADVNNMHQISDMTMLGSLVDMELNNGMAYTAEWSSLRIYDCAEAMPVSNPEFQPVTGFILNSPYPNPLNGVGQIGFELPRALNTSIGLYSVDGKLVRTLRAGVTPAGRNSIVFNSADVTSGTYFIRLATEQGILSRPIVILK